MLSIQKCKGPKVWLRFEIQKQAVHESLWSMMGWIDDGTTLRNRPDFANGALELLSPDILLVILPILLITNMNQCFYLQI